MPFARGRIDPANTLFVHSAPEALTVKVRSDDGTLLARGQNLMRTTNETIPMTRLTRVANKIVREDV